MFLLFSILFLVCLFKAVATLREELMCWHYVLDIAEKGVVTRDVLILPLMFHKSVWNAVYLVETIGEYDLQNGC